MIDALLGALIAVTATTALLAAIQLSESAFEKAGGSYLIEGNQQSVIDDFEIGKEFVGRLFHQGDFVGYT